MTAKTVALSNGFIKYPDVPALMQRSHIFGSSPPVMMIAGVSCPSRRILRSTSMPFGLHVIHHSQLTLFLVVKTTVFMPGAVRRSSAPLRAPLLD